MSRILDSLGGRVNGYEEFLRAKATVASVDGFPVDLDEIHPILKPHQRLIVRYSNAGDVVLAPFSGLGTVPVRALALGRQGVGVELNGGYFLDAVKYLQAEERKQVMPTLFDSLADEPNAPREVAA